MRKFIKILLTVVIALPITVIIILMGLYFSADMMEPEVNIDKSMYQVTQRGDTTFCADSYLHQNNSGLWELYLIGSRIDRGAKQGALTEALMRYQEDVFINQINHIIPSDSYLGFLRVFLIIFNRNIAEFIDLEYREEIAAMAKYCTHEYDAIGSPYERQLNYHAAHDIGHTMQQYMLVGCSSFGVWGERSENGKLLIGRNFDFYVGDDFAKNKIITFANPDEGYKYASIGWAGMVGVLSGINECGLTVTINAAKGTIPLSAKTPISLLTREILQYASTIEEAYNIALNRSTFVNESILIGSQRDGKAAIIEKTPDETVLYFSDEEQILCTNHYQSEEFYSKKYNQENILDSDTKYRYDRLNELVNSKSYVNSKDVADILRDRYGRDGEDIGIGNEMTLNQSIAHHSVVFAPSDSMMWVSTSPWQSGKMVCYNLSTFFKGSGIPYVQDSLSISADSVFITTELPRLIYYRDGIANINEAIASKLLLSEEFIVRFLRANPNHYYTYRILGDYYVAINNKLKAKEMYTISLSCAIPYNSERNEMEKIIKDL